MHQAKNAVKEGMLSAVKAPRNPKAILLNLKLGVAVSSLSIPVPQYGGFVDLQAAQQTDEKEKMNKLTWCDSTSRPRDTAMQNES